TLPGLRDRADALRDWIARGERRVARASDASVAGFSIANPTFFAQWFIVLVIVHPDQRRRGVASALISDAEARATTARMFTSTNQSNTAMQNLLAHLGWAPSGIVDNLDEGDPELIYFKRRS
ncbi:MAG: GNAT family N-acetyltransferase, partial [Kofleriaceae bacterium]